MKMRGNRLQNKMIFPIIGTGREVFQHRRDPNRNAPIEETHMAVEPNIGLRDDSASTEQKPTWKSIGELARQLAEKAKAGK